jgi:proline racemase
MAARLAYAAQHLPWLPGLILCEPRGHKDLYGAILSPPCHPDADIGVIFMNNQGYEPMCGHAMIGVVTSLLETGTFPAREPETTLAVDTPVGLIAVRAGIQDGHVQAVSFDNVPCFAFRLDYPLRLRDGRQFTVDVAFGGNYFVLMDARQLDFELAPPNVTRLAELGMQVLSAANEQIKVHHPGLPGIEWITDARFYIEPGEAGADSRNVVILGEHMVDRSPCGTGTCAELAVRYARGRARIGEPFVTESILGTRFTAQVISEASPIQNIPYPAMIPRLEGRASLTGLHQFLLYPDDPFPEGFLLRD